jgi:hypothetical protein
LDHSEQIVPSESLAVFGGQLSGHRPDNFLPVLGTTFAQKLPANPITDRPVQKDQPRVDRAGNCVAARINDRPQVAEQFLGIWGRLARFNVFADCGFFFDGMGALPC